MNEMAQQVDVLMMPATPSPAPKDLNTTGDAAVPSAVDCGGSADNRGANGTEQPGDADGGAVGGPTVAGRETAGGGAVVRAGRRAERGAAELFVTGLGGNVSSEISPVLGKVHSCLAKYAVFLSSRYRLQSEPTGLPRSPFSKRVVFQLPTRFAVPLKYDAFRI